MRKIIITAALIITSTMAQAQTAPSNTQTLSCPSGYALSIDAPAPPSDDPATKPDDTYKPMTALEKQQAQENALSGEMSHWHCVPMSTSVPAQ